MCVYICTGTMFSTRIGQKHSKTVAHSLNFTSSTKKTTQKKGKELQTMQRIASQTATKIINSKQSNPFRLISKPFSTKNRNNNDDDSQDSWNDAWETAWLPDDLTPKTRAPWETDVHFPPGPPPRDTEAKAFVEEMNENWEERRRAKKTDHKPNDGGCLENLKKDYRLKKQRIHAGLWVKEIEKHQEDMLRDSPRGVDDIDRLLDSYSEIFDTPNDDLDNSKFPTSSNFKNKPDGWETTSKENDGDVWEMSQREEDILLQEFDRRVAYSKFQIASFIKTHIFSRRRPIDGWKYMIEVIGPNAKKGRGSVPRVPSLSDSSTKPYEERIPIAGNAMSSRGR